MRSVSFVAIRDLLGIMAEYPQGLRAKDMEQLARQEQRLITQHGRIPSKTTVYHYRNTLLHLKVLVRRQGRYVVNKEHPVVHNLLAILNPGSSGLSLDERRLFSQLVVNNRDCRRQFFDFFMPEQEAYQFDDFISLGQRVAWKNYSGPEKRRVHLRNLETEGIERWLHTESEIQAILYGVRYWARSELGFIDEVFFEDLGGVMFPTKLAGPIPDPDVIAALLEAVDGTEEWVTLSIRDVVYSWGPRYHISLEHIFRTLLALYRRYSEYIVLIPTAEAFATITATSPGAKDYQLRSYLQDFQGRYISHFRVHPKLKGVLR